MQGFRGMKQDFAKYPTYKRAYIRAFDRMLETRRERGLKIAPSWEDGEHVMKWWLGEDPNQLTFFDLEEYL
jgi:phosphoadenosine phosphosulfate reductase